MIYVDENGDLEWDDDTAEVLDNRAEAICETLGCEPEDEVLEELVALLANFHHLDLGDDDDDGDGQRLSIREESVA